MNDRPTPLGTTPEPPAPSPEPWKVALAHEFCAGVMYSTPSTHRSEEARLLALISKHHDPSCPGPTPTRTEREDVLDKLRLDAEQFARTDRANAEAGGGLAFSADYMKGSACAYEDMAKRLAEARKALEVKP